MRLDENSLGAVFFFADRDEIALFQAPTLANPEHAVAIFYDTRVHPRLTWRDPSAIDVDERRQVGRGEKSVGKDAVRRRRGEPGVGQRSELGLGKIRRRKARHDVKSRRCAPRALRAGDASRTVLVAISEE